MFWDWSPKERTLTYTSTVDRQKHNGTPLSCVYDNDTHYLKETETMVSEYSKTVVGSLTLTD